MDTKKLRQKILDLAIHGKLVPQDPNDEPASVLLERIRAEKEQLIKEGKIKAPKKSNAAGDTSHYGKEGPWALPEGWVWCRFPEIADLISGQDFPPEKYNSTAKGTPYIIGASNFEDGYLRISRWTESPSVLSRKGDVLVVCKGAGVGKMAVNDLGTVHIARQVQAVRIQNEIVSSDFMRILIDWCIPSIVSQANGLIPGLKRELLLNLILPIPPRCEQDRIVSTLSCALAILKRFEEEQTELERDIRKLRERILDLAIHGKLVPQDPSDEPAIELLKRINPDFVPSHNLHYRAELPSGWQLCHIQDIANTELGKTLDKAKNKGEEQPYLCALNVKWESFDLSTIKRIRIEEKEKSRYRLQPCDLLVCEGGDVGRCAIWQEDYEMYYQNAIHRVRFKQGFSPDFYLYVLPLLSTKSCGRS